MYDFEKAQRTRWISRRHTCLYAASTRILPSFSSKLRDLPYPRSQFAREYFVPVRVESYSYHSQPVGSYFGATFVQSIGEQSRHPTTRNSCTLRTNNFKISLQESRLRAPQSKRTILRKLGGWVQNKDADLGISKDHVADLLQDISDSDLLLVATVSALEPLHRTVLEQLPKSEYDEPIHAIRMGTFKAISDRLQERGIRGFDADGMVPGSPEVVAVFQKMHPEMKDMRMHIAGDPQSLAEVVLRNLDPETADGNMAILYQTRGHQPALFVHRDAEGVRNSLFLLDSLGVDLVSTTTLRELIQDPRVLQQLHAERFHVHTFITQRQVSETSCTLCALQDIAAVQQFGADRLFFYGQALATNNPVPGAVHTLPGNFYLHTESMSFLRALRHLEATVRITERDLLHRFQTAFQDSGLQEAVPVFLKSQART